MSLDVAFFAFHKEVADAAWAKLGDTDLAGFAAAHQTEYQLKDQLKHLIEEQRSARTPRAYLQQQGIQDPDDVLIFNTETAIDRGEIVWPPPLSQKQEQAVKDIEKQIKALPRIPPELVSRNFLFSLWPDEIELSWLTHARATRSQFRYDLISLDLHFGGMCITSQYSYETMSLMRCLLVIFFPEIPAEQHEDPLPLFTKCIISLFEKMSKEKIIEAYRKPTLELLQCTDDRGPEFAAPGFVDDVIDFAFEIKPLAQELKTNGGRLIIGANGSEVEDLELGQRADQHMAFLLKRFPWIDDRLVNDVN